MGGCIPIGKYILNRSSLDKSSYHLKIFKCVQLSHPTKPFIGFIIGDIYKWNIKCKENEYEMTKATLSVVEETHQSIYRIEK